MTSFAEKHTVVTFYTLAFVISWAGFVPLLIHERASSAFTSPLWLSGLILPAVGPAAAAAIATRAARSSLQSEEKQLVRLREAFLRNVGVPWWVIIVLLSVGSMWLAAFLGHFFPDYGDSQRSFSIREVLIFAGISLLANPLEEVGWRGFAQFHLQKDRSPLQAALIVGVLWGLWHIPLFLLSRGPVAMSHVAFWPWAMGVVPQAITLAWMYNRTGRSLAGVSVSHVLGNVFGMVFHSPVIMVSIIRLAVALVIIGIAGQIKPSNAPSYKTY